MTKNIWSVEDIVFTMHSEQILSKYERLSEGVYRVATHDGQTFRLTMTTWEDDEEPDREPSANQEREWNKQYDGTSFGA